MLQQPSRKEKNLRFLLSGRAAVTQATNCGFGFGNTRYRVPSAGTMLLKFISGLIEQMLIQTDTYNKTFYLVLLRSTPLAIIIDNGIYFLNSIDRTPSLSLDLSISCTYFSRFILTMIIIVIILCSSTHIYYASLSSYILSPILCVFIVYFSIILL